jgi:YihY family inner membrane protein
MNVFERLARKVDRAQQRLGPVSFVFAVFKKAGDDRASQLAALLTYYGFLSIFPSLLVLVTVFGLVAGGSHSIEHRIETSVLSQFPIIGSGHGRYSKYSLSTNIHALDRNSPVTLAIGIAGLLWGSLGFSQSGQYAMAQVWNIPKEVRPGFVPRLARSLLLIVALPFVSLSTLFEGASLVGAHAGVVRVAGAIGAVLVNMTLFAVVFRILTPKQVRLRLLVPGTVPAGLAWTLLQVAGAYLVSHQLRHLNQLYGFFAIVLGLLWWMYLMAQVFILSAEVNVVLARRLWPRSLVQPPLTPADRAVLRAEAESEERRPEVRVVTDGGVDDRPA